MRRSVLLAALAALTGLSAAPAQDDVVYRNDDLGIRFTLAGPEYSFRVKEFEFGWKGTVCEIVGKDGWVGGALVHFRSALRVDKYAGWREDVWKGTQGVKSLRRINEKRIEGKVGNWLRLEHRMEFEDSVFRYVELCIASGRHNIELALWFPDDKWKDHRETVLRILESVEFSGVRTGPDPGTEVRDGTFLSRRHRLRVRAPEAWTIRHGDLQFGVQGGLMELQKGEEAAGVLGVREGGADAEAHAKAFVDGLRDVSRNFDELGGEATSSGGVRRECRGEAKGVMTHYALRFEVRGGRNYFLSVWAPEDGWERIKGEVGEILESLEFSDDLGGGPTYENKDLRIGLSAPDPGFVLREKEFRFGWPGTLCEIEGRDGLIGGVLVHYQSGLSAKEYADWREESWKKTKGVRSLTRVRDEKRDRTPGEWLLREHTMEFRYQVLRRAQICLVDGEDNFEVCVWVSETMWDEVRDDLYRILDGVRYREK